MTEVENQKARELELTGGTEMIDLYQAEKARAEKAEAALRDLFATCTCHPGFYERGLSDPQCPAAEYGDYARAALNEPPVCRAALAEKEGDG